MADYEIEVEIRSTYARLVAERDIRRAVEASLRLEGQPEGAGVTVVVTSDEEIQALNSEYRGVDAPTDVLSFSAMEGDEFVLPDDELAYLGDVIIAVPRAQAQAKAAGHSLKTEMALLVVHGCLHLMGYDHPDAITQRAMWERQDNILHELGEHPKAISE